MGGCRKEGLDCFPYTFAGEGYDVLDEDRAYFAELEEKGIRLTQGRKVWYSHMKQTQDDLMKQEYRVRRRRRCGRM